MFNSILRPFLLISWFIPLLAPYLSLAAADLDQALANPNNWAHQRGGYNNQGYSSLNQISDRNVRELKLAWEFTTGVLRGHEGAPLVIDGIMYLHTAFPNNVYALDLNDDQKILWRYFPKQDPKVQMMFCCDNVNRGLSFGDGKVFLQQNNGVLVALNAKSGEVIWQTQVTDISAGEINTNAPLVVKDKVLTGCAGGEFGARCFMAAYYLENGQLAWKAYSTGSDADVLIGRDFNKVNPQYNVLNVYENTTRYDNLYKREFLAFKPLPYDQLKTNEAELGIRTWLKPQQVKDGWQNGGGAVTGYFGFDPKTNLIYYGTGNPGVWNADSRPGDNKWASSVFARDVDTGEARWAMQTTPHDEWDYDATNEVILFNSNKITYATQVNKNGFIYTWQADNGTLIATEKVHPYVNWASEVNKRTGVPNKDPRYSTHQDYNMKKGCPSTKGAKGMNPAAYSPKSNLLYIPFNYSCMVFEAVEHKLVKGQPWIGATTVKFAAYDETRNPQDRNKWGGFSALNPLTNKVKWSKNEEFVTTSGVLVTAGNLVFYNAGDRWFKSVNALSGEDLWKFQVSNPVIGNPFSYSNKGKQYIGVLSGIGGGWKESFWGKGVNVACSPGSIETHLEHIYLQRGEGCMQIYRPMVDGAGALNIFSL